MARPRKPLAKHLADGTFRQDRHGVGEPAAVGPLTKPESVEVDPLQNQFWDQHVDQVIANGAGSGDMSTLVSACKWWSRFCKLEDAVDHEWEYRLYIAMCMAWRNYNTAASRLGLSPTERAKLRGMEKPSPAKNTIESFIASKPQ